MTSQRNKCPGKRFLMNNILPGECNGLQFNEILFGSAVKGEYLRFGFNEVFINSVVEMQRVLFNTLSSDIYESEGST